MIRNPWKEVARLRGENGKLVELLENVRAGLQAYVSANYKLIVEISALRRENTLLRSLIPQDVLADELPLTGLLQPVPIEETPNGD